MIDNGKNLGVPWRPSAKGSGIVTAVAQVTEMAQVPSLAWELLHVAGVPPPPPKTLKKNIYMYMYN